MNTKTALAEWQTKPREEWTAADMLAYGLSLVMHRAHSGSISAKDFDAELDALIELGEKLIAEYKAQELQEQELQTT